MSGAAKAKLILLPSDRISPPSSGTAKSPAVFQDQGFSYWVINHCPDWKPGWLFSGSRKFHRFKQLREWLYLNRPEGVRVLIVSNGIVLDYRLGIHWVQAVTSVSAGETWEAHWRFNYNEEYAGEAFDQDDYQNLFDEQVEVVLKYCIHNNHLRTVKGITDEDELYEKAWSTCNGQSYSDC